MVHSDKIKIILDLQCKIATWLEKFNKALSLGQCVEKYNENAIIITNLLKVLYRYQALDSNLTNLDKITFQLTPDPENETYTVTIDYGIVNLVTYSGTGPLENIIQAIVTEINQNSEITGYYCLSENNVVYLYTYNVLATFGDTPIISILESNPVTENLTANTEDLTEDDAYIILDKVNCLKLEDFCTIVCKIKNLLTDCNCK